MKLQLRIKQHFCKHDFEICRKVEPFHNLRGEQLYQVCKKCEKVEPYIFLEYEGNGYK